MPQNGQSHGQLVLNHHASSGDMVQHWRTSEQMVQPLNNLENEQTHEQTKVTSSTLFRSVVSQNKSGKSEFSVAPHPVQARGFIAQFDGAVDELAEMMGCDTPPAMIKSAESSAAKSPSKAIGKSAWVSVGSPTRAKSASPSKSADSPRKSSTTSPNLLKLETLALMVKKTIRSGDQKEGPGIASDQIAEAEKRTWRKHWKKRLQEIKTAEADQIQKYNAEHPLH
jgi:hypothetical protein